MKTSLVAGLFETDSTEEAIRQAAEAGADGIELGDPTQIETETIRSVAQKHNIEIARVFAGGETTGFENVSPSVTDPDSIDQSVAELERSIEAAAELDAHNLLLTVGGHRDDIDPSLQQRTLVTVLRRIAPVAEAADVTVTPEPLNTRVDHPRYFLSSSHTGYEIIQAVDSSHVKLLFDIYHQQITEGNIIQNLRTNIEHIGHIHFADVPGRHEPGTGELHFPNIFNAISDTEYDGFVGAELGPTGDPETAVREIIDLIPS